MLSNTIQSDLIRGHINTIILKALFEGDRYGYDIIKEIEQKSSGQYILKQPTLYSCLKRLEMQGFIRSYWGAKSNGGRRKYYTLTEQGKELFVKNQTEWEYSRTVINKLISDKEYDLSVLEGEYSSQIDDMEEFEDEKNASDEGLVEAHSSINQSENDEDEDNSSLNSAKIDSTENTNEPEKTEEFNFDSTKILSNLFEQQKSESEFKSYSDKLINQQPRIVTYTSAQNYFNDVLDDYDNEENDFSSYQDKDESAQSLTSLAEHLKNVSNSHEEENSVPYTNKVNENIFEKSDPIAFDTQINSKITNKNKDEDIAHEKVEEKTQFLSYATKLTEVTVDEDKLLFEREYKNFLSRLVSNQSTAVPEAPPVDPSPAIIPISREMEINNRLNSNMTGEIDDNESDKITVSKEYELSKKFSALSNSVKELGDNLKIRTHNKETAKEYNNKCYYYSHKLMLKQFGILFFIMIAEICLTFVYVKIGLKINTPNDIYIYLIAVAFAAAFPVVAAFQNFRSPDKKKRINFEFKPTLLFKIIVFINVLVVIYCVNIFMKMPISFSIDYISTLLLPAVLATNLPLSTLIFTTLYNSKRYSA